MRGLVLAMIVTGCGATPEGTLWYVQRGTNALTRLEVGTGDSKIIDSSGGFDNVVGDPSTSQVAYTIDYQLFVGSTNGHVVEMMPDGGQLHPAPRWHSSGWLSYPVEQNSQLDTAVSHPPNMSRLLGTPGSVVFASDGSALAYLSGATAGSPMYRGALIVENPDGTNPQTIVGDIGLLDFSFSPGDDAIIGTTLTGSLIDVSIADGSTRTLGQGRLLSSSDSGLSGAQSLSYDGDHVLVVDQTEVAIVSLTDATRQHVVDVPSNADAVSAFFLPNGDVVYSIQVSPVTGDAGVLSGTVSLYNGSGSTTLGSGDGNSICSAVAISKDASFLAIECAETLTIVSTSTMLPVNTAGSDTVLGFVNDHDVLFETASGDVRQVGLHGGPVNVASTAAGATASFVSR